MPIKGRIRQQYGTGSGHPGWLCKVAIALLLSSHILLTTSAQKVEKPRELAKPDYTFYRKKEDVLREIDWIVGRNPSIFKVDDVWAGDSSYNSTLKVITAEPSGLTADNGQKVRLLLDFGEHGRELVTVEVALRLMELLSDPSKVEAMVLSRGGNPEKMAALLERCVFKILPMENVHGREIVEAGNLCERKNGRGVDSNRNWPVHWGIQEKDYDPSEEFPGSKPFSEPEVQILDALVREFRPHIWMNMHSGMEALFMPYDHVASLPDDPAGLISFHLLQQLNALKCRGKCAIGSGGKSVGYLAHGTATDYMHDIQGVPFSFTWEIFGDMGAHFNDCFRMFNPLTKEHLEQVVANWADAVLAMIELLPSSDKAATGRLYFLHRKLLPDDLPAMGEQIFNHTTTDRAAGEREARLAEVYAVVSGVDTMLGLNQGGDLGWEWLVEVPLLVWIVLLSCVVLGLLFYGAGLMWGNLGIRARSRLTKRKHSSASV